MLRKWNNILIRKAVIQDIKHIHKLLSCYGNQGLLLARPLSELYDHLRDFFVACDSASSDTFMGACALDICWEDLGEIRSLAMLKEHQGKGHAVKLVEACLEEARSLGLERIFALTYVPGFFSKLGFREVEKSDFHYKVWSDCLRCPKFPDCDEVGMILDLR